MATSVVPVILCGGSGSRLWPMSRRLLPKQFLPLAGDKTLFQDTVLRTRTLAGCGAPLVVTNAEQRFLAGDQLAVLGVAPRALLLEPDAHPAAKPFKDALGLDGVPFTSFAVQDVRGDVERLRGLGVRIAQEPAEMGPVITAVIDDTCGNLINLVQPHM